MLLTYRLRHEQVTFDIRGKYNVIIGNSGTGKTFITKFGQALEELPGRYKGNPEISVYGSQDSIREHISTVSNSIIIIDEHINSGPIHDYVRLSEFSDNYFIFCARDTLGAVPYGINTTFVVDGVYPKVRMVPAYSKAGRTRNIPVGWPVVVEDEDVGFKVLKYIRNNTRVETAKGKDKLLRRVREIGERCVIVFDSCGIGLC